MPLTPWQEFYKNVRDSSWPDCDEESQFSSLPDHVKKECIKHGYRPGEYQAQPALAQRRFPILTDTACQLKWNWSTVYLTLESTSSCHRAHIHKFDTDDFDFHNTPSKLDDRARMLAGQWPQKGCDYCKNIERAGGQSDRITNLDFAGMHAPVELDQDLAAVSVTPRMLEVYFDNTCNLKCVYCGPHFSSLWQAENQKHGDFRANGVVLTNSFEKSANLARNKQKIFKWLEQHGRHLTNFNFLGGEPLYQPELDECLDFFAKHPAPQLDFQIFTNLHTNQTRLESVVGKIHALLEQGHIRKFSVTASLDCWGPEQEYARYPLNLANWQTNFEYLLRQPCISLVIGSTLTPLTIISFPALVSKLLEWNQVRPVSLYFNSLEEPDYFGIDIFGSAFESEFAEAMALLKQLPFDYTDLVGYLDGIAKQSASQGIKPEAVLALHTMLTELDRRRSTNWMQTFPKLNNLFDKILPHI